ncbi:MAG: sugar-binding protein, partial [Chryseobacterium sp.]
MKKLIIPIGALLFSGVVQAQLSTAENYVYTKTYLDYDGTTPTKTSETVQYFDGLGRPKQIVNIKASPLNKDVVTKIEYDGFGRQTLDYLPVPQTGTMNGGIYTDPLANVTSTPYGSEKIYAEKQLENSPLDRILSQKQVGIAWNDKPVQFGYDANINGEVIKYTTTTTWENGATKSTIEYGGSYSVGQLYKNTVTDEDGNKTIEFKNGEGQVVLVRKMLNATESADTYYVYNEYNQLAWVIPPLLSKKQTWGWDDQQALSYEYRYDSKGRLVEKRLPGKDWEYMVYDKADRLVLTQDANLRLGNKWLFNKYDKFGRIIYTGIAVDSGSRDVVQGWILFTYGVNTEVSGSYTQSSMQIPYGNTAYPQNIESILTVNFYDAYPSGTPTFTPTIPNQSAVLTDNMSSELNTKGLPLASYVKNIEDDNWTKNYTYYDTRGRVIATHSINHLGGYTQTESKLDFAGLAQQTVTRHKRLSSDTERMITETFEYDNQNRLKVHKHKVDNNPQEEILVQNEYNELSQLITKKVGGSSLGSGLQEVNYAYNIRGWMTQINDPVNLGINDLFGYKINYNLVEGMENPHSDYMDLKVKPKFNGNIAETSWKTATTPNDNLRRYGYVYDGLNRLQAGFYQKDNNPSAREYFEKIDYDLNGNITHLQRSGALLQNYSITEAFDDLTYHYENNNSSNRLSTVTDASVNYGGYPETAGNTIPYDLNGNMTSHEDKGILGITYNFLNLPSYLLFNAGLPR